MISEATHAYIETALWSELDDEGVPLQENYDTDDIDGDSAEAMRQSVIDFIDGCREHRPDVFEGIEAGRIGHDFWLTRNRHGAGFWDRGLGERGDWLTMMAHPYGEASLYVGDDGNIHYQD